MRKFNTIIYVLIIGLMACGLVVFSGCKKAGASAAVAGGTVESSSAKLEETRASVEEAEKELAAQRAERMRLEAELQAKKAAKKE